ncbi:chymotrypsin-1-like [Battus philenor]|uniref:chymotrypsin-1-like n=1 Tax=Battus philenor TaxID=42288 RepID=UPI0035CED163
MLHWYSQHAQWMPYNSGPGATPASQHLDLYNHVNQYQSRIVGGEPAPQGSVPYIVALTTGDAVRNFFCGGSMITTRCILTAAHCIVAAAPDGYLIDSLRAIVGTDTWRYGGQMYSISTNFTYPEYDANELVNDLGFLVTNNDVDLSREVQVVPLNFDYVGGDVLCKAAGWGLISRSGPLSETLLQLYVETITAEECIKEIERTSEAIGMRLPTIVPEAHLCVYHSPGHGMCSGDSGGPLVTANNINQVGVVSWGLPCAMGAPDMFTRISSYESWIRSVIENVHGDRS